MLPNCLELRVVSQQGRGGSTGYDNAVALPARSDSEELAKENNKSTKPLKGQIVFSVAKVGTELHTPVQCSAWCNTGIRVIGHACVAAAHAFVQA